jgi:hypothetical protein
MLLLGLLGLHAIPAAFAEEPRKNLKILQDLSAEIGQAIMSTEGLPDTGTFSLQVLPREEAYFLDRPLSAVLEQRGLRRLDGPAANLVVECGVENMRVQYSDTRSEGFFGPTVVDRDVALTLQAVVTDRSTHRVLLSRALSASVHDTIDVSDVRLLEDDNIPVTQGSVPPQGFFADFLEPVVFTAALGVAIYLLFTVRS